MTSKVETLNPYPGKWFGYIRISSLTQNLDRQEELLKKVYGDKINTIYSDVGSGKDTNRPKFQLLKEVLREGDTLVIESFSRLSRSTRDLLNILEEFSKKNITVISHKENFDYSTASGKMLIGLLGNIVEYEKDILLERQKEGIALAKEKGKYKGRKPIKKPSNFDELFEKHLNSTPGNFYGAEMFRTEIKFTKSTFYRILKEAKAERKLSCKDKE